VTWVALSLGSNIDAEKNIKACLDELLLVFRDMSLSSVFESEAVGFSGDNFLNMVVTFDTEMSLAELVALLKKIEDKFGRDRSQPKFSGRKLDIDVLLYGKTVGRVNGIELPRAEICENAFVLWPLSQVAGEKLHPALKQSFTRLWQDYNKDRQNLWPIDFQWHGRKISHLA
jgi:2-amino-4-hydroxy-6-hydroxymethyldihydropteridine diphosphokinase